MLKIVQSPNSILTEKAKPVQQVDKTIRDLIKQMEEALDHARDPEGIGLAAPQVGKSLQIFIIRQTPRSPLSVFINPSIIELFDDFEKEQNKKNNDEEKKDSVQLEGCLSLYSVWGAVNRRYGVILKYLDENGKEHKKKFEGFIATIIQHEYDHLQGTLFPKRVLEQNNKLYRSSKNEKGETEFDEIEL